MPTPTATENLDRLKADPIMVKTVVESLESCMTMCDTVVRCVGLSTIPSRDPGSVTGLIGVHGDVSGFISVNLAERVAMSVVGGLLQDHFPELTHQVIDGVGEIANIVSGGIKKGLVNTPWAFSHVTVPSVIVGHNYQIAYAKGIRYLAVTFEQENTEAFMLEDRLIQVAVSLMRV